MSESVFSKGEAKLQLSELGMVEALREQVKALQADVTKERAWGDTLLVLAQELISFLPKEARLLLVQTIVTSIFERMEKGGAEEVKEGGKG